MPITIQERIALLRQASTDARRQPDDLFGTRMAIHDAFEGTGVNSNRVCDLLLTAQPPLSEWDCNRLEMVANLMELQPEASSDLYLGICEVVRMLTPA